MTDFSLCVKLLSGDTNKVLNSADLKAVLCFILSWRTYLDQYCKISAVVPFILGLNFVFLFQGILMYDNELWTKDKIEPLHS